MDLPYPMDRQATIKKHLSQVSRQPYWLGIGIVLLFGIIAGFVIGKVNSAHLVRRESHLKTVTILLWLPLAITWIEIHRIWVDICFAIYRTNRGYRAFNQ
jgi:ABC-type nitrate/sulfonate/bicarbonate transport system permease component